MKSQEIMTEILARPLYEIIENCPVCEDFFFNLRLAGLDRKLPLPQAMDGVDEDILAEFGIDAGKVLVDFAEFLEAFGKKSGPDVSIKTVTVIGGCDKSGRPELPEWTVSVGETVSIVGPTGSGKSRLLADIECLADEDTPTGRMILIDGRIPTEDDRCDMEGRLVAQLSQNMNFVMDLTVREFLEMHAGSRLSGNENAGEVIRRCFACANRLAGEKFDWGTKVTQLSGGQSRALMIADTAYMSASPIVLIDEIENAGIDRQEAIEILAKKEKIVLISTHDPLLALGADKRIIIRNGGVAKIIRTSEEEKRCLKEIEKLDAVLYRLRNSIRQGEEILMENVLAGTQENHV